MATGLKRALRLSGRVDRPVYPGFMVVKMAQEGSSPMEVPSKVNCTLVTFLVFFLGF